MKVILELSRYFRDISHSKIFIRNIYYLFFTNMKICFIETTYHYEANICAMRQRKQMSVIDTHDWY